MAAGKGVVSRCQVTPILRPVAGATIGQIDRYVTVGSGVRSHLTGARRIRRHKIDLSTLVRRVLVMVRASSLMTMDRLNMRYRTRPTMGDEQNRNQKDSKPVTHLEADYTTHSGQARTAASLP